MRETVYESTGKMAAVTRVLQNCMIRGISAKHALSRAPCIVATSMHHPLKQQNTRQYNTLTKKFKVK